MPLIPLPLALFLVTSAAPRPALFRYAPPDGTRQVATTRTTRTLDEGGTRLMTRTLEVQQETRVHRLAKGFELTVTTLSARLTLDGKPVDDPLLDAMVEVPLLYEVDDQGRLTEVRGFKMVEDRLHALFERMGLEVEQGSAEAPAMAARELEQWNTHVAALAGKPVQKTTRIRWKEELSLAKGPPVPFTVEAQVDGTRPCAAKTCQRLVLAASPSADTPHVQLSGEGERIVDPATLLPYGERLLLTLTSPGKSGPVVLRDDRTIAYEYSPSAH